MANRTDIIRLLAKGVSQREIAQRLHCSRSTVSACLRVMHERGVDAEALTELDEASIRQCFFPRLERTTSEGFVEPDFESVCKRLESNRKLTLKEIWFQYSSNDPQGKKNIQLLPVLQKVPVVVKELISDPEDALRPRPGRLS